MYIPKKYGQSKVERCPFCGQQGTTQNSQGVSVCRAHKDDMLDLKCLCGKPLDIREGKWGAYCNCLVCGNMNMRKALEINGSPKVQDSAKPKPLAQSAREMVVRSDDPRFFD